MPMKLVSAATQNRPQMILTVLPQDCLLAERAVVAAVGLPIAVNGAFTHGLSKRSG